MDDPPTEDADDAGGAAALTAVELAAAVGDAFGDG